MSTPSDLPEGDVVRILLEQHARIRELFKQVHAERGKERQPVFDELRRLLAAHEVGEEMVVRPVTRLAPDGGRIAGARNEEEDQATHALADLEKLDVASPEFTKAFNAFERDVLAHAEHEEAEEFPLLLSSRGDRERALMGRALHAAEAIAPTHPHPSAAGSTVAQYVLGPYASLLDHARDALKKAMPGG